MRQIAEEEALTSSSACGDTCITGERITKGGVCEWAQEGEGDVGNGPREWTAHGRVSLSSSCRLREAMFGFAHLRASILVFELIPLARIDVH